MTLTWRALYCVGGQEAKAADAIRSLPDPPEVFFPYEEVTLQRRVKEPLTYAMKMAGKREAIRSYREVSKQALFPNYVFADTATKTDGDTVVRVREVDVVLAVVSSGGRPAEIPAMVIKELSQLAAADGLVSSVDLTRPSSWFKAQIGDRFKFKASSPFYEMTGLISELSRIDKSGRLKAWVEMMGASVEVELEVDDVGKILSHGKSETASV